jgi:hypothetical protein
MFIDLTPFIPLSFKGEGEYNKKRANALLNSRFREGSLK